MLLSSKPVVKLHGRRPARAASVQRIFPKKRDKEAVQHDSLATSEEA